MNNTTYPRVGNVLDLSTSSKHLREKADTQGSPDQESKNNVYLIQEGGNDLHRLGDVSKSSHEHGGGLTNDREERGPNLKTNSGSHIIHRPRPYRHVHFAENLWTVRGESEGDRPGPLPWPHDADAYCHQSRWLHARPGSGEILGLSPFPWYGYPSNDYQKRRFGFQGEGFVHDSGGLTATGSNISFSPYFRNPVTAGCTNNTFPFFLQYGSSACTSLCDRNHAHCAPSLSNRFDASLPTTLTPTVTNYRENRDPGPHGDLFTYGSFCERKPHNFNAESTTRTYPNFKKDILAKMSSASKTSTNQTRMQIIPRSDMKRTETSMDSQSPVTPSVSLGFSPINKSVSPMKELNQHSFGFRSRYVQFGNNSAFSSPGGAGFRQTVAESQEKGWTGLERNDSIMHQDDLSSGTSKPAQVNPSESNSLYSITANSCNENNTNSKETSKFSIDGALENSVSCAVPGKCCGSIENKNNTPLSLGSEAPVPEHTDVKIELNDDMKNVCGFEARGEPNKEQTPVSEDGGDLKNQRKNLKENYEICGDMNNDESINKTTRSMLTNDCLDEFKINVKQEEPVMEDEHTAGLVGAQTGIRRGTSTDDSPKTTRTAYNDQIKYSTKASGVNICNNWSRQNHEWQTEKDVITPFTTGTKQCLPGFRSDSCCMKSPAVPDAITSGSTNFALGDITNYKRQLGNSITTNRSHFTAQPWNPYNRAFSQPTNLDSYDAVPGTTKWAVQNEINTVPNRSLFTTEQWTLPNWFHPKSDNVNPTVESDIVLRNILLAQEERTTYKKQTEQNALCHVMTEPKTPFAISLTRPTGKVPWVQENKPANDTGSVRPASSKGYHEHWKTNETSFSKNTNLREQIESFTRSGTPKYIDRTPRGRACSSLNGNHNNVECKDIRKNKEALVSQSSTTEPAKPNNTLKCGDCHEPFLSFSALLQHKGQDCGRQNGMSIHASDCVGKGCSLRGATENHRKQCECAHCLDCGRVFKSKYKVFTHSLRGCGMSSSSGRSHMSPARACRNGVSAQSRPSDFLSKNMPLKDRWYQDGESTGAFTPSTLPDSNGRAGGGLQSWPFHTNPTCETSTGVNTFGSFSVEPKPFINDLKPTMNKQGGADLMSSLYLSVHQVTSDKAKTVPKPGTLTSASENISKAVYDCNGPTAVKYSQEKNSKSCFRQSEQTDVNDKGCSSSKSNLDNTEDENATDGLLKSNRLHDSEGHITNIQINEDVIDTLLGTTEACPADSQAETETRGSMTTSTCLEGVKNGSISQGPGKEKENLIRSSFKKETTQDYPLTDFSKPHQATERSEISQIGPSDIIGARNEKTALTKRKEIQTGETKCALECHDPSEKESFAYLATPSAFMGLIPLNHASSPNNRDKCIDSAACAHKPNPGNMASKPISPVSSPNYTNAPTRQKLFVKSLKRKLQDTETQVVFSEELGNSSSYCDNPVARNAECLSVPGRNSSNCHCLLENGYTSKEGTLLLLSRKTNEVSLDAESDAEKQIPRAGRKEIAGKINALSAQTNIDGCRIVPNSGTVVKTPTAASGNTTTNHKTLNRENSFSATMKKNIAGKPKMKKKKKKKMKIAHAQKDKEGLKEMSTFHFPLGALHVQGSFWNSEDFAMPHMLPLKTAKTYGRRDELLENGEKQTIMYVLDANNKPVMLVKKENPDDLYGKVRVTLTTKATKINMNEDGNTVSRSKIKKPQKTDVPAAATLVN